jgi:hypothetical protein
MKHSVVVIVVTVGSVVDPLGTEIRKAFVADATDAETGAVVLVVGRCKRVFSCVKGGILEVKRMRLTHKARSHNLYHQP